MRKAGRAGVAAVLGVVVIAACSDGRDGLLGRTSAGLDAVETAEAGPSDPPPPPNSDPEPIGPVQTDFGKLTGVRLGASAIFKAIRYADPPTNTRRWKPPTKFLTPNQERTLVAWPPQCVQSSSPKSFESEDCLYLNVWTPAAALNGDDTTKRAVMVFFHGGAFIAGSTSETWHGKYAYDGQKLSEAGNVVVVTVQFRLGALGYLAHPMLDAEIGRSGNYGLLDQLASLEWVRENIAAFGGNPQNVTIFGQSSGGGSVCGLLSAPKSSDNDGGPNDTGLFQHAIIMSGSDACAPSTYNPSVATNGILAKANQLISKMDCASGTFTERLACMRLVDPFDIMGGGISFGLVTGGSGLPNGSPLDHMTTKFHRPVDLIVGTTSSEYYSKMIKASEEGHEELRVVDYETQVRNHSVTAFDSSDPGRESFLEARLLDLYPGNGDPYIDFDVMSQLLTDERYICTARRVTRMMSKFSPTKKVFRYSFAHRISRLPLFIQQAQHGTDTRFVFGTDPLGTLPTACDPTASPSCAVCTPKEGEWAFNSDERKLSGQVMHAFTQFAWTGNPNPLPGGAFAGDYNWDEYVIDNDNHLRIVDSDDLKMRRDLGRKRCDFWDARFCEKKKSELYCKEFPPAK